MRHLKRISFFLYTCMLFAAGFYSHFALQTLFYPGKRMDLHFFTELKQNENEDIQNVFYNADRLNCDSEFIITFVNLEDASEYQEQRKADNCYVGMDREQFAYYAADGIRVPLLSERQEGLVFTEILTFSPKKVEMKKYYKTGKKPVSFFLCVNGNYVTVYEKDSNALYLQTAIDARLLPENIRSKVIHGMEFTTRQALENFLVSYAGL